MLLTEIINAIKPQHIIGQANPQTDIQHLLTDSRELKKGDGTRGTGDGTANTTLFFALRTAKNDGAKYIPELYAEGVRAFVLGNGQWLTAQSQWVMNHNDAAFIVVADALEALQDLAAEVRNSFNGTVIGITGSNGKTVVKEWLYQLLKDDYTVIRSPKSYNSQIGVPLSVWQLSNSEAVLQSEGRSGKAAALPIRGGHQPAGRDGTAGEDHPSDDRCDHVYRA